VVAFLATSLEGQAWGLEPVLQRQRALWKSG
jgi:hypothetical protein